MHELIIIGGGPAGAAAGVYAARKMIATLLVAEEFGGQSVVSGEIQNWIGTPSLTGLELARSLEGHLRAQDGTIEMWDGERVEEVVKTEGGWGVRTSGGKTAEAKTLLLASGSRRKKLGVPGEDRLSGRGVVYCSTCDAPLFKGKATAVVGGGNAALEAVLDLVPYASEIHLIVRSDALKGDAVTQERVRRHSKVNISFGAVVKEIRGVDTVTGIELDDTAGGVLRELPVEGVFVEIGAAANSDL
ncbi:MAG: FAD-dependent oxidoreductase, partial [Candidatus Colwellbacteria bacterium]|nr:FAD-dependent oxidoreductase [Candidatus Colwellbacteria bacterium]